MKGASNIVISVGQAGNQIASSFWNSLCAEHGIDQKSGKALNNEPIGKWNTFFSSPGGSKYIPRAIIVDLEPSVADSVKEDFNVLFNPTNIITGTDGAGNNFAVGHYRLGNEFIERVLTAFEKEAHECEHLGGIMVFHSLGGGSGSGFGTLIIKKLKELYPNVPLMSCAIFPSPKVSSTVTEPYNAIFSLDTLKKYADACLVLDNDALFDIAKKRLKMESPNLKDLNFLITEILTAVTASMRFSGSLSVEVGMRELITNLVPHPNLHFLLTSTSPLLPSSDKEYTKMNIDDMTKALFSNDSMYAACEPDKGKYLSVAVLYRGDIGEKTKADTALASTRDKLPFSSWIPTAFKVGSVTEPGIQRKSSMVLIANNTEIATVIERICDKFDKLWAKKAFSFWYTDEGMEENEILVIRNNIGELAKEYRAAAINGTNYLNKDQHASEEKALM